MDLALIGSKGRGRTAEASAGSVRDAPRVSQTARASPLGPMTAKRRSSGSTSCPARARCGGSHSEGTTAFRSGQRTASASRFSPIATATSPSSGSPPTAGHRRTPDEARTGRITCAGVVVSEGRPASVQRHEGVRRVVVDVLAAGQEGDAVRRGPLVESHRRGVLARWAMGGLREHRTGHDDDLRPAISSHGRQVSALRERSPTTRMQSIWSPDGKELFYNPRTRRIRGRQRHDATDVCVRQSCGGAETVPDWVLQTREGLRHHARRQVRGPHHRGTNGVRCAPPLRRSRSSSTG